MLFCAAAEYNTGSRRYHPPIYQNLTDKADKYSSASTQNGR